MGEEGRGERDNAGVVTPPPLIYLAALAAGMLVNSIYPARLLPRIIPRTSGLPLILGGFLIGLLGVREMRKAQTNIDPYRPVHAIVDQGPFRFTRNPIYVSFTLMYLGLSVLANALWPVLLLPGVLTMMQRGVIEREEAYLERKFGGEYLTYKEQVRRWL